jgi:nucleoside-diphosphate-sugar epimerase
VVVFGANGKTGRRCVARAAAAGARVVACTRAGDFSSAGLENARLVEARAGDVSKATDADLRKILRGCDAAIFAASASPSGGTPQEVDKAGLVKVAAACVAENVKRLVIVSSGSVSKPLSPVYVFLNFFGGVMRAKIEGEDAIRAMYVARENCDYVVIRPGGLTEDPARALPLWSSTRGTQRAGVSVARTSRRCASRSRWLPERTTRETRRSSATTRTPRTIFPTSGSPTR